jgi:hypothetical protein
MSQPTPHRSGIEPSTPREDFTNLGDEERALGRAAPVSARSRSSGQSSSDEETEPQPRRASPPSGGIFKRKTAQFLDAVTKAIKRAGGGDATITPNLATLVEAYRTSEIAAAIQRDIDEVSRAHSHSGTDPTSGENELPDVAIESLLLKGRKRASWATQFRILSGRAFKNLYRDPALLTAHYTSSIALACEWMSTFLETSSDVFAVICGLFFHNVTYVQLNDCGFLYESHERCVATTLRVSRTDLVRLALYSSCDDVFLITFQASFSSRWHFLDSLACRVWHSSPTNAYCSCEKGTFEWFLPTAGD